MSTCHTCNLLFCDVNVCSACRVVNYCSTRCQKKDWKIHKLTCHRRTKRTKDHRLTEMIEMCNNMISSSGTMPWHPYLKQLVGRFKKANWGRSPLAFITLPTIKKWMRDTQPPEIIYSPTYINIMELIQTIEGEHWSAMLHRHKERVPLAERAFGACIIELSRGLTAHILLIMDKNDNARLVGITLLRKYMRGKVEVWGFGTQGCKHNYLTMNSKEIPIDNISLVRQSIYLIALNHNTSRFTDHLYGLTTHV